MGCSTSKIVVDNKNYLKCTLSIDIHLKDALLEMCRDPTLVQNPLPADGVDLFNFLNDRNRKKKLNNLMKFKKIFQDQYDLLLPKNSSTDSTKWDITIISLVAIQFLGLSAILKAIVEDARKSRNGMKHGNAEDYKVQQKFDDTMNEIENLLIKLNYTKLSDFQSLRINNNIQIDLNVLMKYHKTLMDNMEDRLLKEQTKATQDILKQVTDSFKFQSKYFTFFQSRALHLSYFYF